MPASLGASAINSKGCRYSPAAQLALVEATPKKKLMPAPVSFDGLDNVAVDVEGSTLRWFQKHNNLGLQIQSVINEHDSRCLLKTSVQAIFDLQHCEQSMSRGTGLILDRFSDVLQEHS